MGGALPDQGSDCQVIPFAKAVLSRRRPVPSAATTKVPWAEVAENATENAIVVPSGDQNGGAQLLTQHAES
jgi:hypothetical protein